ncbi:MAG: twin-arginine translocase subunit TatC [Chloroflexota bacterium]|nr:twin-arginine translocase subunit TatC [Chloroflexota bacterium]
MTMRDEVYEGEAMPLVEHLREFRDRLIKALIGLIIGMAISMPFAEQVLKVLVRPLNYTPIALSPTDTIVQYIRVSFIGGVALAMPIILYQVIAFLLPALTQREKRYLFVFLPAGTILFVVGLLFGAFVAVPLSIFFLQNFGEEFAVNQWHLERYISFVTTLLLALGLGFQTPLVIFFIAKLGIVNYATLTKNIRWAFLITAILAAVLTPTPDPWNMLVVMAPLFLLYLLGVLLARWA